MTCQWNVLGHWRPNTGRILGYFGPLCAVLPSPNPILGSLGPKTMIWPYPGLRRSNRNFRGTVAMCNPPLFVVSTPQIGPNAPLKPYFGPSYPSSPIASWDVMDWVPRGMVGLESQKTIGKDLLFTFCWVMVVLGPIEALSPPHSSPLAVARVDTGPCVYKWEVQLTNIQTIPFQKSVALWLLHPSL